MQKGDVFKEMVENGTMHEGEVPFDESKNEAPDTDEKTIPYVMDLEDPIKWAGEEMAELTFVRKPKTADVMHLPLNPDLQVFAHYIPIIASCCNVPNKLIKELSFPDLQTAFSLVNDFLTGSPKGVPIS